MMHFFAHFWFWFISIFIYLGLVLIGDLPISVAIGVILGIIVVFCLVAFYIISRGYKNGLVKYVLGVLSRIPGMKRWTLKFWARHSEAIKNIDEQIAALYAQDTKAFYKSLVLEYLSRVVQSMEVMFMLLLFGIDCGGGLGGLTLTFLQPYWLPAHAVGCSGGWIRTFHCCPGALSSSWHLCEYHLPCA